MKRTLLVLGLLVGGLTTARAQGYAIVVNAVNPVASASRQEIANIFLKKTVRWSDGTRAVAIDQPRNSKVREAFTSTVLRRSVGAVDSYWQQQIFAGKDVPPAEKGSDADVIAFVRANVGAVGYVSSVSGLPSDLKVLPITGY